MHDMVQNFIGLVQLHSLHHSTIQHCTPMEDMSGGGYLKVNVSELDWILEII